MWVCVHEGGGELYISRVRALCMLWLNLVGVLEIVCEGVCIYAESYRA